MGVGLSILQAAKKLLIPTGKSTGLHTVCAYSCQA